jgi:hypothetical protein
MKFLSRAGTSVRSNHFFQDHNNRFFVFLCQWRAEMLDTSLLPTVVAPNRLWLTSLYNFSKYQRSVLLHLVLFTVLHKTY